jgi:HAD superfamily hydrolase (TIGR01509 family)
MKIQAAVFDMDGTIFDTERLLFECLVEAASDEGWELKWDVVVECAGTPYDETEKIIMREMGPDFPYETVRKSAINKFQKAVDENGVPFKNGAKRLFDFLDAKGVPYGLATTTQRVSVDDILGKAGIADRFKTIVCGDEVPDNKPQPDIYYAAAKGLGFDVRNLIVFEDSANGISSAVSAGARVIWVPDLQDLPESIRNSCYGEAGSLDAVRDRWGELSG